MAMFSPDMESATDIISLAISIEAQALDLYFRASEKVDATEGKKALARLGGLAHATEQERWISVLSLIHK